MVVLEGGGAGASFISGLWIILNIFLGSLLVFGCETSLPSGSVGRVRRLRVVRLMVALQYSGFYFGRFSQYWFGWVMAFVISGLAGVVLVVGCGSAMVLVALFWCYAGSFAQ
ncbi:hypothetical protein TSUD_02260 [Trifolium subterraneum]|nr:hypothetical protein TSUD_02260 [Trifolium subterraneum]